MTSTSRFGANLPASFMFERSFQGIDEFTLANGLRVLLFEDASQANVTVNLTYLVGSRHEGRGEAGMAHLLEHMLFRGTKEVRDVKGALQDKGAHFNATTWYDRTNYFETLTPTPENLEFALKLEADRMINSLILQEDLDSEMTVVRNEFEMGENNPVHVLHDQLMSCAYRWHNYGKTTIGNRSDIERVPVSALRKFYEHYYQPDNAVLVVAGQFDPKLAMQLIDRYFACIKKPTRILDETYTEEPAQDGPREVILERVGDMASVAVGYHIPAASHHDHAALKVFFDCITDEPGGHIYQELVAKGLCSEVFTMVYALYEPGMAMCFVRPTDDKDAQFVREQLVHLVEHKAFKALDEQQVERIKTRALKRIKLSLTNSKDLALKLSEAIACGDWRLFFWYREQILQVSFADVKRVAERYVISSNRTSGIFVPLKEPKRITIEKAPPVEHVVAGILEDASLAEGDAFVATPRSIEERVNRREIAEDKHVAVLVKKTRGHSVRAELRFRFGNTEALTPAIEAFWLMPSMFWRGTNKYSYQGIRDRIDSLMSTLDVDGNGGVVVASIKSERQYVKEMLDFAIHMLAESSFAADEFAIVKQREIDNYEEVKSDPQRLGFQELERLKSPYPKGDIHYVHSFDEIIAALNKLSLHDVKDAYKRLVSLDHCFAAVVGDCDEDELVDHIKNFSPKASAGVPYARVERPFIKNIASDVMLDCPDKEMAIIAQAFNFPMRDDDPDFPALKIANYLFGENMNSRLMHRIREKEGISYGAGSSIEISRHEKNASLNIYAMAAPDSLNRAKRAIDEEWKRFLDDGITEDELAAAQKSIWLSFENMLGNDGFLVRAFARDLEIGRTFLWREQLYTWIKSLTTKDVETAARRWWGEGNFSRVAACDLSKMK